MMRGSESDFWSGFAAASFSSAASSLVQGFQLADKIGTVGMVGVGALSGGLAAELSGGDFGLGAISGAWVVLFNHMLHGVKGWLKHLLSSNYVDITDNSKYPGVKIHLVKDIDQGYFNPFSKTINVPQMYAGNSADLHDYILHEYGHYLQLDALQKVYGNVSGMGRFISGIMIPSMVTSQSPDHMMQWYEINANNLAKAFTGDTFYNNRLYKTTP